VILEDEYTGMQQTPFSRLSIAHDVRGEV
jgi:hypothetical protein